MRSVHLNKGFKFTLNTHCLSLQDMYLELNLGLSWKSSIYQEHFFQQQIGLKYTEETSEMLH
jgi:hypothetical protein